MTVRRVREPAKEQRLAEPVADRLYARDRTATRGRSPDMGCGVGWLAPGRLGLHTSERRARCPRTRAPSCETRSKHCRTRVKRATLVAPRLLSNVLCSRLHPPASPR